MNFSGRAGLMISSKIDAEAAQIISNNISSECLNAHRIKQHMKEIQKKSGVYNPNLMRKHTNSKTASTQVNSPTNAVEK